VSAEQAVKALGKLPHWWEHQLQEGQGHMRLVEALDGTSRVMATYPLRNGTWINMSWFFQTQKERESTTESWDADGDRDEILEIYDDFDSDLKTLLR
jgi:salicylate hydroxylase